METFHVEGGRKGNEQTENGTKTAGFDQLCLCVCTSNNLFLFL